MPMYPQHFRLTGEAFALTPDPAFVYLSPGHAEALAALKVGLQTRRGLLVMVGEVGIGKTTLLYSLLSAIGAEMHTAYTANTALSMNEMLRAALSDFGVPCAGCDRLQLLEALNGFLVRCAEEGTTAVLVIDEAQNLSEEAFEHIRLLSNFESFSSKLLQIVLVGQPELDTKLRNARLRQVAERVAVRCHINPLSRTESRKYIAHRLDCVGGSIDLFTPRALRLLIRHAQGIPRRINILCHNALLFAYGADAERAADTHVRAAVREWHGQGLIALGQPLFRTSNGHLTGILPRRRLWWQPALVTTAAALVIGGAVAGTRWNSTAPEVGHRPTAQAAAPAPADVTGAGERPWARQAVAAASPPTLVSADTDYGACRVVDRCTADSGGDHASGVGTVAVPAGVAAATLAQRMYAQLTPTFVSRSSGTTNHE